LEWASKRFDVSLPRTNARAAAGAQDDPDDGGGGAGAGAVRAPAGGHAYGDFADFFDAANPSTENDRALVAAYWIQVIQGEGSFMAFGANEALRNMGHEVSNITRSFDRLQAQQPALVRQLQKSGKSKQARKTYKLTTAGIKAVEEML
jgi:hypothetical protein